MTGYYLEFLHWVVYVISDPPHPRTKATDLAESSLVRSKLAS